MFRLQAEDLRDLGLDPNNLRTDGQPTTRGDVAAAHRWYRAQGMKVRGPDKLLETAVDHFTKKFGPSKEPPPDNNPPATPNNPAAPRLEVSVDRTARRQAVPQQPSRTAQPAPSAQQQPQQSRDRSAVVADMQRRNAQRRGTTFGLAN